MLNRRKLNQDLRATGTETEMEAKAHESGREIGVEEFAYLSPRHRRTLQNPNPAPLSHSNLKTQLTFLTMKMKICASCYLHWLCLWLWLCSFFGQTKKYVGPTAVCVCGFVKSASVISVRLNGAKQTWAKNSDRKRPQRGPTKIYKLNLFYVGREREREDWERERGN